MDAKLLRLPGADTQDLQTTIGTFLQDLEQAGRPANMLRAYRSDLAAFASYHAGPLRVVTPEVLRSYFSTLSGSSPATRSASRSRSPPSSLGASPKTSSTRIRWAR